MPPITQKLADGLGSVRVHRQRNVTQSIHGQFSRPLDVYVFSICCRRKQVWSIKSIRVAQSRTSRRKSTHPIQTPTYVNVRLGQVLFKEETNKKSSSV